MLDLESNLGSHFFYLAFSLPARTGMIISELSGRTFKGEFLVDRIV